MNGDNNELQVNEPDRRPTCLENILRVYLLVFMVIGFVLFWLFLRWGSEGWKTY